MEADVARVIAAVLWLSTAACSRADSPLPISGTLSAHLEEERFETVTSIGGLSLGVADGLRQLFGTQALDIADPDGVHQGGRAAPRRDRLPSRRLVAAGCSSDHCLVYYQRAGDDHGWRVALFHWGPDATRFEWGGAAPGGLTSLAEVRHAILSRRITSPEQSW